jgi:cytidylate kinase
VIERAGEWVELAPDLIADAERRKSLIDRMLGHVFAPDASPFVASPQEGRTLPSDAELRRLIKQVLASFADEGSVVIVSHAASYALGGRDVLRVLVTASPQTRADRISTAQKVELQAARQLVKEDDAGRADYLKRFYGVEQERPADFDLVVNTDVLTPEKAAALIVAAGG